MSTAVEMCDFTFWSQVVDLKGLSIWKFSNNLKYRLKHINIQNQECCGNTSGGLIFRAKIDGYSRKLRGACWHLLSLQSLNLMLKGVLLPEDISLTGDSIFRKCLKNESLLIGGSTANLPRTKVLWCHHQIKCETASFNACNAPFPLFPWHSWLASKFHSLLCPSFE